MSRTRLRWIGAVLIVMTLCRGVRAQTAVADAWLASEVAAEKGFDDVGRYVALGVFGVLGSFFLVAPALIAEQRSDVGPIGASLSIGAGALLLNAAVGSVIIADPTAAERWAALSTAAGFVALHAALVVSSLEARSYLPGFTNDSVTGERPSTLGTIYGTALAIASVYLGPALTSFVVDLALPTQSPSALRAEIETLSEYDRHDRIRDFLARSERRRAWKAWSATALNVLAGGLTIFAAQHSSAEEGRVNGSWIGIGMIGYGIGSLISYAFSNNAVTLLDAGEYPRAAP